MQAIPCAQYYNLKWEGVFIMLHYYYTLKGGEGGGEWSIKGEVI